MKRDWQKYEDAKKIVKSLKIKGYNDWRDFVKSNKIPKGIPMYPNRVYSKRKK